VVFDAPAGTEGFGNFCFYPINNQIEVPVTTVPTSPKQLDGLPGAVTISPGSKNIGSWSRTLIKQQYHANSQLLQNAGVLYAYFNNKSMLPVQVACMMRVNCRFYGPVYNIATATPIHLNAEVLDESDELSHEEVVSITSKQKKPKSKV